MRCLKRNKRPLYLCTVYEDNGIAKFHNPIELKMNYQATNSDGDLIALGLDFPKYIRIKSDLKYKNTFHPKDRIFIKASPIVTRTVISIGTNGEEEEHEVQYFDDLCKGADYEVDSDPRVSLNVVEITLKRLSGKE